MEQQIDNSGMHPAVFYTYIHRKLSDGEVFYVGKGTRHRANSKHLRSEHWTRVVAKHGLSVEIVAYFWCEADAFAHERELIASFRAAKVRLVNATDGGEGASGAKRSAEVRQRMAEAGRNRPRPPPDSPETRERKRVAAIGRRMSPEAVAKSASFQTGRQRSEETLARMSRAQKGHAGRSLSPAEIEAVRLRSLGREVSAETRARQSEAMKGRKYGPQSAEHREKIAEARRQYWARRKAEIASA